MTIEKLSGGPVGSIYQIGDSAVIRPDENILPALLTNVNMDIYSELSLSHKSVRSSFL
jgi:hypothetical protein